MSRNTHEPAPSRQIKSEDNFDPLAPENAKLDTVVTLPNKEEMLTRLADVTDIRYIREKYYPYILKHVDGSKNARDIAIALKNAYYEFGGAKDAIPMLLASIDAMGHAFIDALIDDKDVAAEAKRMYTISVE